MLGFGSRKVTILAFSSRVFLTCHLLYCSGLLFRVEVVVFERYLIGGMSLILECQVGPRYGAGLRNVKFEDLSKLLKKLFWMSLEFRLSEVFLKRFYGDKVGTTLCLFPSLISI